MVSLYVNKYVTCEICLFAVCLVAYNFAHCVRGRSRHKISSHLRSFTANKSGFHEFLYSMWGLVEMISQKTWLRETWFYTSIRTVVTGHVVSPLIYGPTLSLEVHAGDKFIFYLANICRSGTHAHTTKYTTSAPRHTRTHNTHTHTDKLYRQVMFPKSNVHLCFILYLNPLR